MFKRKASAKDTSSAATPTPDNSAAAQAIAAADRIAHPFLSVNEQPPPKPEPVTNKEPEPIIKKPGPDSCIGSGMSIVGKIDCNGPAQVFGRVEGELRASDLMIGDGAEIEGNIVAQNVIVCGHVKGSIHAVRVALSNGGCVEGDIFHQALSIDEKSLLEGSSRRVENPTDLSSNSDRKGRQKKDVQMSSPPPSGDAEKPIEAALQ
jgi:cytoskeletal protein CcmA (bactofilin family)